ncbi:MAG TPA: HAMP domain-containing sensor histidine kinase [Candidatus Limiplasma sp.]|nr:HAMP domain-containing sensor histidine kinase [Candidatus Limiplasma sp.]HPS80992.1 HAMP domain-containing sensor histidine kinase [Candidatus Limiplasma sp.]
MFHSMFSRLFSLLLLMILVVVFVGAGFSIIAIRNNMIASRMESLLVQAREIAFLASRVDDSTLSDYLGVDTPTETYLQWKAANVYQDFGAYILIVDRNGRVKDNMITAIKNNPDTVESLTTADVTDALSEVLTGKEIQTRITNASSGTVFTVAVPWVQNGSVLGAVFIHTSAQIIEAEYRGIVFQIVMGFSIAALVAAIFALLYTRSIVRPLTVITRAAEEMSRGKFNARAAVTGANEVRQLAGAFNVMADKLAQVEENRREFVANVSHELRSPVTSIHGFVEGMLDGTIPKEEYERYLQVVSDETNRLKKLITDLLELSRMEKGVIQLKMTAFDINEAIRRVIIGRVNDIEQRGIELHLDFEQEPCPVYADQDQIAQVITNLVDNALKFINDRGNLTIRTSLVHDRVSVVVANDGAPILPEDRPHIFERFYKADKAHTVGKGSGTGLGLSICQRIIQQHGQTIGLLPTEVGAAFEFTLQAGSRPMPLGEGGASREKDASERE